MEKGNTERVNTLSGIIILFGLLLSSIIMIMDGLITEYTLPTIAFYILARALQNINSILLSTTVMALIGAMIIIMIVGIILT